MHLCLYASMCIFMLCISPFLNGRELYILLSNFFHLTIYLRRDHAFSLMLRILMFSSSGVPTLSSFSSLSWPEPSIGFSNAPFSHIMHPPFLVCRQHPAGQICYFMMLSFPIQGQGICKRKGISYISYLYINLIQCQVKSFFLRIFF